MIFSKLAAMTVRLEVSMSQIIKHKIDPVGAAALMFGAAVIVPSIAALGINLLAVAHALFSA